MYSLLRGRSKSAVTFRGLELETCDAGRAFGGRGGCCCLGRAAAAAVVVAGECGR